VLAEKAAQMVFAVVQRKASQIGAFFVDEQIEAKELGRRLTAQLLNARRGGMKSLQECVEVKVALDLDDDLAIEDEALGWNFKQSLN
jgi:hypothetical protein